MQLSSLENDIRNKLEKRRISPSDNAWDKLESELGGEEQKFKKSYWWVGIAASFLFATLIYWLVFSNQGAENAANTKYFSSEQQKITNTKIKPPLTDKNPKPAAEKSHKSGITTEKKGIKPATKPPHITKVKPALKEVKPKSTKPNVDIKPKDKLGPKTSDNLKTAIAENIDILNNNNKTDKVTDAEIENLLREARLKINAESASKKYANNVDASALLQEVETERDKPLKERIFETLKDGFQEFKGMLASSY